MPSRNSIKEYRENGVYHIYNRGIDKREIFLDRADYSYFLYLLKIYLLEPELLKEDLERKGQSLHKRRRGEKSFFGKIELLCYCLMPNHFHLLIKQKEEKDITEFTKSLMTSYSMYFNLRYKRQGTLFQGRYKAALVKEDDYLLHLSRYIHMNPMKWKGQSLPKFYEYDYSSYADYLGRRNTKWINTNIVLDYFNENKEDGLIGKSTYKSFVEEYATDSDLILGDLILE